MKTNFKGTRGKVKKINYSSRCVVFVNEGDNFIDVWGNGITSVSEDEMIANAQLIVDAFKIRQQINFDLPELLNRYNELERWKKEASIVFSQVDFQELGKLLNVKLGSSISEQLLPKVSELLKGYNKAVELLEKAETQLNPSTFYGENEIVANEIKQFLKTLE